MQGSPAHTLSGTSFDFFHRLADQELWQAQHHRILHGSERSKGRCFRYAAPSRPFRQLREQRPFNGAHCRALHVRAAGVPCSACCLPPARRSFQSMGQHVASGCGCASRVEEGKPADERHDASPPGRQHGVIGGVLGSVATLPNPFFMMRKGPEGVIDLLGARYRRHHMAPVCVPRMHTGGKARGGCVEPNGSSGAVSNTFIACVEGMRGGTGRGMHHRRRFDSSGCHRPCTGAKHRAAGGVRGAGGAGRSGRALAARAPPWVGGTPTGPRRLEGACEGSRARARRGASAVVRVKGPCEGLRAVRAVRAVLGG